MTSRQRIQKALRCRPVDRPPVWIMRQAGRYLPEYRELKKKYGFLELVKTPELAVEVTLQPLRRFALDAAIVFSDILVIPEALGQPYHFRDEGGIAMDYRLKSRADIEKLDPSAVRERLDYVACAERLLRARLANGKAILGFAGSPWTLAAYMVEGGSSRSWSRAIQLFREDPPAFHLLMEKLVAALIDYLDLQAESGIDAIQIFDSWAGACPAPDYWEMSLTWIQQIVQGLRSDLPVILYAKGVPDQLPDIACSGVSAVSLDWEIDLRVAADLLPRSTAVQGNLDPALLDGEAAAVKNATSELLRSMQGRDGFILNLGHGIHPTAKLENVQALVHTVTTYLPPEPSAP